LQAKVLSKIISYKILINNIIKQRLYDTNTYAAI